MKPKENIVSAILVEDSRLARAELKELLKEYRKITIVDEAENANQAYLKIQQHNPDVLFLDINMPGKTGFELLEQLDSVPVVIFTTAYDEFAIKSFEYNAFDYLLKPINKKRFAKTMDKLFSQIEKRKKHNQAKLTEESQLFIKEGEKCWMVTLKEITLFEITGNYTRVYFKNNKPLIYKSLNKIEEKLPDSFFRVNRQQIINLKDIIKLTPWFNDKLKISLKDDLQVEASRRQTLKLRKKLTF